MIHGIISLVICALSLLLIYLSVLPVSVVTAIIFAPAAFYIGREFAQAEYRYIEKYCNRKRANMKWYDPFKPSAWTAKSLFDFLIPLIVSLLSFAVSFLI